MFQALITADWHLSNRLPYAQKNRETLVSDRLLDAVNTIDWIINEAATREVPLLVLGDIFDRRQPDAVALKMAMAIFGSACDAGIDIYILPGNHDAHDNRGLHYVVDALAVAGWDNLTVFKAGQIHHLDGANLCPIPFSSRSSTISWAKKYSAQPLDKPRILLMHDTIQGSMSQGWIADEGLLPTELAGFECILAGHIHQAQKLPRPLVGAYVGSPYQKDFGESKNHPTITLLTVNGVKTLLEAIPLPPSISMPFCTQTTEDGANWHTSGDISQAKYVRVIFTGTDKAMEAVEPQMLEIIDGWKKANKKISSVTLIHRGSSALSGGRMGIDLMEMPAWNEIIKGYVDLQSVKKGKNADALVADGVSILKEI
jgi:DNA repair exonuclease SbcCD nuclease subunit